MLLTPPSLAFILRQRFERTEWLHFLSTVSDLTHWVCTPLTLPTSFTSSVNQYRYNHMYMSTCISRKQSLKQWIMGYKETMESIDLRTVLMQSVTKLSLHQGHSYHFDSNKVYHWGRGIGGQILMVPYIPTLPSA